MYRRTFLKLSLAAPLLLKLGCTSKNDTAHKISRAADTLSPAGKAAPFLPSTDKSFEFLEVKGTYKEIGYAMGKYFGKNMNSVMGQRKGWIQKLQSITETGEGKNYSRALQNIVRKKLPQFVYELEGMSEGSGIDFNTIWLMSIQSELNALNQENLGCSTIYYKDKNHNWLFHNEDGHDAYGENMFVMKATPPSGVTFITLVYPGIIPGVGPSLNSEGIIETTNFIGCNHPEIGIPRYFLGRSILEAKSLDEALQIASSEPRAFPWHHNLASMESGKYVSIETLPDGTIEKRPIEEGFYLHTNHTTGKSTKDYKYQDLDYKNSSSISRYEVLSRYIKENDGPVEDPGVILKWLSSRENAPYSPCRIPEGDIPGRTLATAFFNLNKGTYTLYKGTPDQSIPNGRYEVYGF